MSRHRQTITGRPVVITSAALGIGRSLAFDALARVAPAHYFDIIAQAEKRLRPRRGTVRH